MKMEKCIQLEALSNEALKQYGTLENRITAVTEDLYRRIGGNSRGSLMAGFVFSGIWMVVYLAAFFLVEGPAKIFVLLTALMLTAAMMMDTAVRLKYYGEIIQYKASLTRLQERLHLATNSIRLNRDAFLKTAANGWDMELTLGESIPEETDAIATTLAKMETLQAGFLHKAKNVLYHLVSTAITVGGSMMLLPVLDRVVVDSFDGSYPTLYYIGIAVAVVIQFCIARFIWAATDCEVRNRTLFGTITGPVVFAVLCAVVILVVFLIAIALYIAGLVIGVCCLWGSLCGG